MPDPTFSPVLQRNKEWSDLFGGASTNLAQRQRYADDQARFAEESLAEQERAALDLAHRDRTAQDFYFRQKDLERRQQMDEFTRGIRHGEQRRKEAMLPLQMDTERARSDAQNAMAIARMNKEKRDAGNALRVAQDTDSFEGKVDQLMQAGIRPGSKDFADNLLGIISTHPYVPSDLRKFWMAQADIEYDPDQFMRDREKYKDTHTISWRISDKGKLLPTFTEKSASTSPMEREHKLYLGELDRAKSRRAIAQAQFSKELAAADETTRKAVQSKAARLPSQDLVDMADEDIRRYDKLVNEAQQALKGAPATTPTTPTFKTADEVKAAYQGGSLTREDALKILRENFGL